MSIYFKFGMIVHVLATGQYPSEVLEAIDRNSEKKGIKSKRLQQLTESERESIKGNFTRILAKTLSKREKKVANGRQ